MTKILIVEDEPNMVAGLRDNFEFEGYEVLSAYDGSEGLEKALATSPDLVLLDVMMPKMDGKQFREQQRLDAALCEIPVIVCSSHDEIARIARSLEADDYLTKPFDASQLVDAVARCARTSPDRTAAPR